jgi:hypothetical protein
MGVAMFIVSDNLRKGAALNAIQIAEEVLSREMLAPRSRITAQRTGVGVATSQADQDRAAERLEFERAQDFYERNHECIVSKYEGKYVAILHNKIVDSAADFSELAERVYGRFGYRDLFMPHVERRPRIVHVRSPRVVERHLPT